MEIVFSVRADRTKVNIAPHTHNCHEIVFYGQGCEGMIDIGENSFSFKAGDVSVNPAGEVHSEIHTGRGNVCFFGFFGDMDITGGVYSNMWFLQQLFRDILKETRNQEYGYKEITDCKIREIITYIKRRCKTAFHGVKDLSHCRRYIDENFMHRISIPALGRISGYSGEYFRHLFTEEFGISPQQYIVKKRLDHARRLLENTDIKCTEIAGMSGFSDSGQLTKMFSAAYGVTPLKYRRKMRG